MSDYTTTVLSDSPVSYYLLNEGGGSTAFDSSGNGHDATYTGTVSFGSAYKSLSGNVELGDGANSSVAYIACPTNAFSPSGDFSLEFWCLIEGNLSTFWSGYLMEVKTAAPQFLDIAILAANNYGFPALFTNASFWGNAHSGSGAVSNDHLWHHVVIVFDSVALTITGYFDGSSILTDTSPSGTNLSIPTEVYIGGLASGAQFPGRMSDVAFYHSTLSSTRVSAHYAAGIVTVVERAFSTGTANDAEVAVGDESYRRTVLADGPSLYWRLDETSGTTAADSSGNGNAGTYSVNASTLTTAGLVPNDAAILLSDSSTKYVNSVTNPGFLGGTAGVTAYTLEMVVNFSSFGTGATVLGSGISTPTLAVDSSGQASHSGYASTIFGPTLSTGTTYHLCGTWDGATVKFYVNGTLYGSGSQAGTDAVGPGQYLRAAINGTGSFVADEIAFYGYALNASKVASHYANLLVNEVDASAETATATADGYQASGPMHYLQIFDTVGITGTLTTVRNFPTVFFGDVVGIEGVLTATAITAPAALYTVTKPDTCGDASYSPDGTKIVFTEKIGSTYKISTINSDGTGHTVLTSGSQAYADPTYSADGVYILFAVQTGAVSGPNPYGQWAIKVMRANGTGITTTINDGNANQHPVWINQTHVAFQSFRYGTDTAFHVTITDAAGNARIDVGEGEYPRLVNVV